MLVVVDDLDQADDGTIDVLFQLAAALEGRTLFAVAARTGAPQPMLDQGIRGLIRSSRVVLEDLETMSHEDAAALVRAVATIDLTGREIDAIVDRGGGNPFFLIEFARAASEDSVPLTPEDAVLARFIDIAEPHASMLGRLAVAGGELEPAEVAALSASSRGRRVRPARHRASRRSARRRRRPVPVSPRNRSSGLGRPSPTSPAHRHPPRRCPSP